MLNKKVKLWHIHRIIQPLKILDRKYPWNVKRKRQQEKPRLNSVDKDMMEIALHGDIISDNVSPFFPKFSSILKATQLSIPLTAFQKPDSLRKPQHAKIQDILEYSFPAHLFPLAFLASECPFPMFLSSYQVFLALLDWVIFNLVGKKSSI